MENQKEPGPLAASKCLVHVRGEKKKTKNSLSAQRPASVPRS